METMLAYGQGPLKASDETVKRAKDRPRGLQYVSGWIFFPPNVYWELLGHTRQHVSIERPRHW